MKTPISAKQLAATNPVQAARLAASLKPELYCVILGSAVGDSDFIPLTTLNDASAAYRAFCNRNGFGARDAGTCKIYQGNKVVAFVSYNGKVWEGAKFTNEAKLIFDPYAKN